MLAPAHQTTPHTNTNERQCHTPTQMSVGAANQHGRAVETAQQQQKQQKHKQQQKQKKTWVDVFSSDTQ